MHFDLLVRPGPNQHSENLAEAILKLRASGVRLSPNARRCSLSQILASVHRYSHGLSLRKHCVQDRLVFRASSDGINSAMSIVSCVIGGPFIIASSSWLECAELSLGVKMQFNERCLTGIHF
jgi:hypothetical protein